MKTINVWFTLSSFSNGDVVYLNQINIKGASTINYVLTGISEAINDAVCLDVNWGDTTSVEQIKRSAIDNESAYNSFLGLKPGTILTNVSHIYNNTASSVNVLLSSQFNITFRDGRSVLFVQPLQVFKPSYHDDIKDLNILSTQIIPLSASNTFINLEGKFNFQTYVCVLDRFNPDYFGDKTQYYVIVSESWEYLYSPNEEFYLSYLYSY